MTGRWMTVGLIKDMYSPDLLLSLHVDKLPLVTQHLLQLVEGSLWMKRTGLGHSKAEKKTLDGHPLHHGPCMFDRENHDRV